VLRFIFSVDCVKMPAFPFSFWKSKEEKCGVNAILLGPPGCGKGTQVMTLNSICVGRRDGIAFMSVRPYVHLNPLAS